jgi:hypothetical protein
MNFEGASADRYWTIDIQNAGEKASSGICQTDAASPAEPVDLPLD